jgi:histidyl-tRNA synthetase
MVGTREMEESTIGLKNMKTGEQRSVNISELISTVSG